MTHRKLIGPLGDELADAVMAPMTGYDLYLATIFPTATLTPPTNKPRYCLEPNPENPTELCRNMLPGHEGEHTWWYCTSEYGNHGDWSIECELKRGHDGDHEAHW
jgi:hypothetical protein